MWYQKTLTLSAKSRGFHLVTDEILNQLADMPRVNIGLLHLLLQHTSASLTLNENCDPTVRHDVERFSSAPFPTTEMMSMTIREQTICLLISNPEMLGTRLYCRYIKGRIQTGTWQGIWLGEHRIHGDRVASSRHYKGSKNDHFNVATILHGKTRRRTERA
ncbi:secondary thiamine-phosphate synthase enzyme YjbQ [Shigella flexneri]